MPEDQYPLACGCYWTLATPRRCGLCNCCHTHCQCAKDGTLAKAKAIIRKAVKDLAQGKLPVTPFLSRQRARQSGKLKDYDISQT